MKQEYIEKIYAGWLAKIIGIRLGAVVEGWTYEKIAQRYGEVTGYLEEYINFAADDDSNGPFFLVRALEEGKNFPKLEPQDVADALMNYAGWEHGFFWFGGYGVSTEHTAFLNLWNGIPAPRSGSAMQNGWTVAEQIGGQIFIDCWGLINPGNTERAAQFARAAASVTHDGNGIWGGIFVAVCISCAFEEKNIQKIIQKGLDYIPQNCEYAAVVRAVCEFYEKNPENWRDCFFYIKENWGYDKYPGNCHIIPNAAVMILALLYGEGDFDKTLCICTMCGWDTDCNVGNIATIMGVRGGIDAIDEKKWREEINDLTVFSGNAGALNISDIPEGASYMARLAYMLDGQEPPAMWKRIWSRNREYCHFEFPGSTHAFRIRGNGRLENTSYRSAYGTRSLLITFGEDDKAENRCEIFRKTYYEPKDFSDSRYDPSFSPTVYPGQTVRCRLTTLCEGEQVCLYAKLRGKEGEEYIYGEKYLPEVGKEQEIEWRIPEKQNRTILEIGIVCEAPKGKIMLLLHELNVEGKADYCIDFSMERLEKWNGSHCEISQFTREKGLAYLEKGKLHLTGTDWAEVYTGNWEWENYETEFEMTPLLGEEHFVLFRVQGAIRSYGFGFTGCGRIGVWKKEKEIELIKEMPFSWEKGQKYCLKITLEQDKYVFYVDNQYLFTVQDSNNPWMAGGIGLGVRNNSHCSYDKISVHGI